MNSKETKKTFDIAGFGISTLDHLYMIDDIKKLRDVNFISDFKLSGGGVVPTALVTLERLGLKTAFITLIADDWTGQEIKSELENELIDCTGIEIFEGQSSPFSFIQVDKENGERIISFFQGISKFLRITEKAKKIVKDSNILHIDGYNPMESIKLAKFAKKNRVKVSLDVNTILKGTSELLSFADYLIIPETFLFEYAKNKNVEYALKKINKEIKPEILIATLGSKGSIALINNEIINVEAFDVEIKDTTGAGDVYHGAFIFGLINEWDIIDIMIFASAVSAINCMFLGGREGIPGYQETIRFLDKNGMDISRFKLENIKAISMKA